MCYIQFAERFLSYDILRHCRQHQISGEIPKKFNQEKFVLYAKCKELLISAANRGCVIAENLKAVEKHFGDDLEASRLSNQLGVLSDAV